MLWNEITKEKSLEKARAQKRSGGRKRVSVRNGR